MMAAFFGVEAYKLVILREVSVTIGNRNSLPLFLSLLFFSPLTLLLLLSHCDVEKGDLE